MEPHGRMLGDRYELQSVLASGGMGRVWRGRDTLLQRPVAVKVLRGEYTGDRAFLGRFRAEAQHTAVLSHPNIAKLYDYGEIEQDGEHLAYLVMELVEGESLATLLQRERRLDVPQTFGILRSTAAGLAAAHAAGVVHRDVKPGNVLLGPGGVVKITDFGIAWSASSTPLTQTGQVIGTAQYLSPEQAAGGKASPASDVYALGAVAYECLTGRRIFEGENPVQIAVKQIREEPDPLPAELPTNVRRLVERALCKDPAGRFPDGAALLAAVEDVLSGRPPVPSAHARTAVLPMSAGEVTGPPATRVLSPPAPAAPAPTKVSGRRALVRMLVGVLAVLAVLGVAVVLVRSDGESPGGTGAPEPTVTTASTTPSSPAAEPTRAAGVELVAEDFVGRQVQDVQAELVARGLVVDAVPKETADAQAGQVLSVAPAGLLSPGTTVTVLFAVPPVDVPTPQPENGRGNGNGKGNGHGNDKDD
jgi:eukaryotic-like serine/threonine-protein kinase